MSRDDLRGYGHNIQAVVDALAGKGVKITEIGVELVEKPKPGRR